MKLYLAIFLAVTVFSGCGGGGGGSEKPPLPLSQQTKLPTEKQVTDSGGDAVAFRGYTGAIAAILNNLKPAFEEYIVAEPYDFLDGFEKLDLGLQSHVDLLAYYKVGQSDLVSDVVNDVETVLDTYSTADVSKENKVIALNILEAELTSYMQTHYSTFFVKETDSAIAPYIKSEFDRLDQIAYGGVVP